MKIIIRFLCLIAALAAIRVLAVEPRVVKPEDAGMSGERLARINTWLRGLVESRQAAGFVSLVARHGKVVHHEAHGRRGLDSAEPMPRNALFDLASMTKPITVAAALMLLEEGKYTLGEPIADFIPEFSNPRVETAQAEVQQRRLPGQDVIFINLTPADRYPF